MPRKPSQFLRSSRRSRSLSRDREPGPRLSVCAVAPRIGLFLFAVGLNVTSLGEDKEILDVHRFQFAEMHRRVLSQEGGTANVRWEGAGGCRGRNTWRCVQRPEAYVTRLSLGSGAVCVKKEWWTLSKPSLSTTTVESVVRRR